MYSQKINSEGGFQKFNLATPKQKWKNITHGTCIHTGSAISIIKKEVHVENFSDVKLKGTAINLRTYSNESIAQLGVYTVTADLNERLVEAGILSKVEHSEWGTPIVPIPKKEGLVRISGDFKVTINHVLVVDQYSLIKIEDIFAS